VIFVDILRSHLRNQFSGVGSAIQ